MCENTTHRVERVLHQVHVLQHQRETCWIGGLSSLCLLLTVSLGCITSSMVGGLGGEITVLGLTGTVLLHAGGGGYVLAGLLAFVAGVIITALCLKKK